MHMESARLPSSDMALRGRRIVGPQKVEVNTMLFRQMSMSSQRVGIWKGERGRAKGEGRERERERESSPGHLYQD